MNWTQKRDRCSEYAVAINELMDGELPAERGPGLEVHLEACPGCKRKLEQYRQMAGQWRALPAEEPHPRTQLQLKVAASHYSARDQRWIYYQLRLKMLMQALAVPLSVGTCAAIVLCGILAGGVTTGIAPNAGVPDVMLGNATPPSMMAAPASDPELAALVEANIDTSGRVYGYRILRGPTDPASVSRLNEQLLNSVFKPAISFAGQPTIGNILVSFGTIEVRG